jgi:hypothetical protein
MQKDAKIQHSSTLFTLQPRETRDASGWPYTPNAT